MGQCELLHIGELKNNELENNELENNELHAAMIRNIGPQLFNFATKT
jgi:hypothetical protein